LNSTYLIIPSLTVPGEKGGGGANGGDGADGGDGGGDDGGGGVMHHLAETYVVYDPYKL
jgi:hypothetical protein